MVIQSPVRVAVVLVSDLYEAVWLLLKPYSNIFHSIASKGKHSSGHCFTHMAFEQGGIFIVPHLL